MLRVLSLTLKTVSNLILIQDRFDVGGNTRKIAIQLACEQQTHFSGRRFTSLRKIARYFSEGGEATTGNASAVRRLLFNSFCSNVERQVA